MKSHQLDEYLTALQSADPKNGAEFHNLLAQGVELLDLLDKDIAHEFGVSRPTVTGGETVITRLIRQCESLFTFGSDAAPRHYCNGSK